MNDYRVKWSRRDRCYRIEQRRREAANPTYEALLWMRFGNEQAAHDYVCFHGLPPRRKLVRVRAHVRMVPA